MAAPSSGSLQHEDESAFSFAGTGQLLGTNELGQIVQKFSDAVSRLSNVVDKAGTGTGTDARRGILAAPGYAPAGGGFAGLLPGTGAGAAVRSAVAAGGMGGSGGPGGPGAALAVPAGARPGGGFGTLLAAMPAIPVPAAPAGAPGFAVMLPVPAGGAAGAPGGGAGGPGVPVPGGGAGVPVPGGGGPGGGGGAPGGGGPGGGGGGGGRTGAFVAGYAVSRAYRAFSNFSNNSLQPQITMSSYLAQQMSTTSARSPAAQQAILSQAFGSNAMATGVADAAVGQSTLNAISGFTAGAMPGYAQPLAKGAQSYNALLNYPNGLSYSQSSAITSQLMSPQTAMNFMMLGLGKSAPLQIGGKVNTNAASMFEGLFSKLAPGENQNQLRYNLRSGGVLSSELGQVTGLSGSNLESFITSGLDVSKLQSQGLSTTKINQLMQQAGTGNKTAQKQLQGYGVNLTDLQAQKDVTATKTSKQASIEQSFASGLDQAAQNLVNFNNALNAILKNPLINQVTGYSSGYKAEAKNQGNLLQTFVNPGNSIAGRVGGFFSHLFGGGAGTPAQKTQKQTAGQSNKNANSGGGISKQGAAAVHAAETQLGVPYVWGGEIPGHGFDCSGLVQWSYEQAGIELPRTSQAQWSFLRKRQVPLNKVQEGDILFAAGSDGTASAPGHEALMVSQKQLIQAPFTGQNVQIDPFDPSQWLYAARPAGALSGSTPGGGGGTSGSPSNSQNQGNAGGAPSPGVGLDPGSYGSADELSTVTGALLGGIAVSAPSVSTSGGNGQNPGSGGGNSGGGGGGKPVANTGSGWAILQKTAARFGWGSGAEWAAWQNLEKAEDASASPTIKNPASGALGIGQALAHGTAHTAGTLGNQYGGFGLSDAQARQANSGNAAMQALWQGNYIKATWHDPIGAWAHEKAVHWYGTGTPGARPGWGIVGDRGPELMHFNGGEKIFSASQSAHLARQDAKSPQSHPYKNLLSGTFSLPDLPQSPAAAAASGSMAGGGGVNINFGQGSIMLGQGVTAQDAKNFVQAVADAAQKNSTITAIANGALHG